MTMVNVGFDDVNLELLKKYGQLRKNLETRRSHAGQSNQVLQ